MTIESVNLTQEGTSLSGQGSKDGFVNRNYTAHFRVKTDDATTAVLAIENHFRTSVTLPWYGRYWKWSSEAGNAADVTSICKKIEISHIPSSEGIFRVEAQFEPIDGEKDKEKPDNEDGEKIPDPLEWREQMSISYTQITEAVNWAIFHGFTTGQFANELTPGTAAMQRGLSYIPQNSALVPYDPLPEKEIDIKVIRMTKNIPFFDSAFYDPWISSVNTDPVFFIKRHLGMVVSIDPFLGRLKSINASSDFQNGVSFVRREIEIWVNPNGWRGRLPDLGHAAKPKDANDDGFVSPGDLVNKPAQSEVVTIRDVNEYPMTAPLKLDGFGRVLLSTNPHKAVWTNWQYYDERQWTGTVDKW